MRLTWVIVRKDLYRLRWVLALWSCAMIGGLIFAELQSFLDDGGFNPFQRAAWMFGDIFFPVIGLGLVLGVQDDDPVCHVDAFWITRPISRGRLLGAKLLVFALLGFLPSLVMAPFWIRHAYGLGQLGRAVVQTTEWQLGLILLALPFAEISLNSSRFVINVALGATGCLLLTLVYHLGDFGGPGAASDGLLESRCLVAALIALAAALAVTVLQYFGRRTWPSIVVLVAAPLTVFLVAAFWSRDFRPRPDPRPAGDGAPGVRFSTATVQGRPDGAPPGEVALQVDFQVSGLGPGDVATATSVSHRLTWPGGSEVVVAASPQTLDLATACWELALGLDPAASIQSEWRLPSQTYSERKRLGTPGYAAAIEGAIRHPRVAAVLPASTGARSRVNGCSVEVGEVMANDARGLVIILNESAPRLSSRLLEVFLGARPISPAPAFYFLVNRGDGRSLMAHAAPTDDSLEMATVGYFRTELVFDGSARSAWKGQLPANLAAWVREATLVKIVAPMVASFHRLIQEPAFEPTVGEARVPRDWPQRSP